MFDKPTYRRAFLWPVNYQHLMEQAITCIAEVYSRNEHIAPEVVAPRSVYKQQWAQRWALADLRVLASRELHMTMGRGIISSTVFLSTCHKPGPVLHASVAAGQTERPVQGGAGEEKVASRQILFRVKALG